MVFCCKIVLEFIICVPLVSNYIILKHDNIKNVNYFFFCICKHFKKHTLLASKKNHQLVCSNNHHDFVLKCLTY